MPSLWMCQLPLIMCAPACVVCWHCAQQHPNDEPIWQQIIKAQLTYSDPVLTQLWAEQRVAGAAALAEQMAAALAEQQAAVAAAAALAE